MNVLVLQSFLAVYHQFLSLYHVILAVYLCASHVPQWLNISCLMCSICQPSPHLNGLLYVIAMAEVLYTHSLDLMEAYHMLNVGSPQGAPQLLNVCFLLSS